MKLFLIIISLHAFHFSDAQLNKWEVPGHWKLYDIHKIASLRYPVDTLKFFKYVELPDEKMQYFLKNIIPWPNEKHSIWMGAFIASCEIDHKLRKVDINMNGVFLYDEKDQQYYQLPADIQTEWIDYLNEVFEKMPAK